MEEHQRRRLSLTDLMSCQAQTGTENLLTQDGRTDKSLQIRGEGVSGRFLEMRMKTCQQLQAPSHNCCHVVDLITSCYIVDGIYTLFESPHQSDILSHIYKDKTVRVTLFTDILKEQN